MANILIVTNNPLVKDINNADYQETDLLAVLYRVRDLIHKGHRLISHPLAGSVKPNETPYKSVVVTRDADPAVDFDSLRIIEGSIQVAAKMLQDRPLPAWDNKVRADFQFIDNALLSSALQSLSHT
ncbi:MAG: GrdX family protein [Bacillota bacterium]